MEETRFSEIGLSEGVCRVVAEMGYERLTPIQARGIPLLLAGKDLIGQSRTGSGKTAAFAIPFLEKIDTGTRRLQVLVLCPTRELCAQVAREVRKLGRYKKDLQVIILCGGEPVRLQLRPLEHGAHVVVGTPGRILDHLGRRSLDLGTVETVILDEADRMLDMGFRDAIEEILGKTSPLRQTALFSATFPPTIENLSRRYQKSPERITVVTPEAETPDIEAIGYLVDGEKKAEALLAFLNSRRLESVLIFCNQKVRVDEVGAALKGAGFSSDRLHGDLEQNERERVMAKFRNHTIRFLVATDVAARGLDVAGLDAVVNYDLSSDPEQYVHRIGRTGRAGAKGLAVSFVTGVENPKLRRIEELTGTGLTLLHFSALKFAPAAVAEKAPEVSMDTISIGGGRKDKLRPGDILGALTGEAGLKGTQIGKIEILDRIAFVAVERGVSRAALKHFQGGKIKGRRFTAQMVK